MWKKFSQAPLWRIVLSYFALFFAVHRGAMAVVLGMEGDRVGLAVMYGLQVACALFLFTALRWYAHLVVPALLATGGAVGASALVGWGIGAMPPALAAVRLLVAVVATGAFAFAVRFGLKDDEQGRDEGAGGGHRPHS